MERDQKVRRVIPTIAEHYGFDIQIGKTEEELGELMTACLDFQIKCSKDDAEDLQKSRQHLIEELADSRIMIDQITFLLDAEEEVDLMAEYKTQRQVLRISREGKGNGKEPRAENSGET